MSVQAYDKETIDALYAENERLRAALEAAESDDHEWYLQAKEIEHLQSRIELLEAVVEAAKEYIYRAEFTAVSHAFCRLHEALAAVEDKT